MIKVGLIKLSKNEKEQLEKEYSRLNSPELKLEDIIKENENQTLAVLRQLKTIAKLDDIEDIVNFVGTIKKAENATEDYIELDDSELKATLKVFETAAKSGNLSGVAYDKIVDIYTTFKE